MSKVLLYAQNEQAHRLAGKMSSLFTNECTAPLSNRRDPCASSRQRATRNRQHAGSHAPRASTHWQEEGKHNKKASSNMRMRYGTRKYHGSCIPGASKHPEVRYRWSYPEKWCRQMSWRWWLSVGALCAAAPVQEHHPRHYP